MAVHSSTGDDQDEEVVWYAEITGDRYRGQRSCSFYLVQYFDVCSLYEGKPNVSGCYRLVGDSDIPIDQDNIIDKVVWVQRSPVCACDDGQENCKYFLGDDQYDKHDKMLEVRIDSRK